MYENNYVCDGQMTIFDFPEYLPEEDFQTMTSKRASELVGERIGAKFQLYERYFDNYYKAKKDGFEITIGFSIDFEGNRFLDTEVDKIKGNSCYGNPAKSIDDCVRSIKRYIEKESNKLIPCPHKEKCYNHPAGCKGLSYWCKRYDKEGEK